MGQCKSSNLPLEAVAADVAGGMELSQELELILEMFFGLCG